MRKRHAIFLIGISILASRPIWAEEVNTLQTNQKAPMEKQVPVIKAKGVIKAMDVKNRKITLQHEAIPELKWGADLT